MRVTGATGVVRDPPAWLTAPADPGRDQAFDLPVPALGGVIPVRTWSPPTAGDREPLPLLVVHDGPEYDTLASLTQYLAAGIAGGWLPRAAGGAAGSRAAEPAGTRPTPGTPGRLRIGGIPALTSRLATSVRIGMGTSLGGLAMLHAHCRYPDAFDALFLQSGSFFSPRLDGQERRFRYYRRITAFVAGGVAAACRPGRSRWCSHAA